MKLAKPLAIAIAMALSSHAFAQATPTPPPTGPVKDLEAVTVVGSNLKGIDLEGAQPVTILDADAIKQTGAQTVTELLNELSQTGGGTGNFSTANSGSKAEDSPAGFAGVSLRGLGTASTLTLVNGRRIAAASFANGSENFVDVNSIPLSAVERVEVLTTGASAVYGADAVAGVVNFVLRKDFTGSQLSISTADSLGRTDEARNNINFLWGAAGEKARGMLIIDAYDINALYDRDREITAVEPRPSQQGIYPSFNDLFAQPIDLVEASCPDAQRFDGRPGFPNSRFGQYCSLNRNAYTATVPSSRRLGAMGTFAYDLGDGREFFSELTLQRNRSLADSEPAPWSDEEIPFDHPGMPAELRARLLAAGVDPGFPVFGYGRFPDARTVEVKTRSLRFISGFRGQWGEWDWETAVNYSKSRSTQEAVAGIYNVARFRAALKGELCASGATNCAPGAGGLYYDPFNGQASNGQQVLDLLRETVPRDGESTLVGWDLKFNGLAGKLGGGDIGWAFGVEARREKITDEPSPLATADPVTGDVPVYGFGSTAVQAKRVQWALYGESYLPFTKTFDVRLAGRYDHYDDFGGDFNPSIGLRWRPSDAFLVRGGWNSSFRAPSLAQSGAGVTLSSGSLPCANGSEFFASFCGGFAGDDGYLSEIYGNPDLKAETSSAWYLGTVFELGANTTLKLDYFDITQKNLVDVDALDLFRQALRDPSLVVDEGQLGFGQLGIETRGGALGDPVENVNLQLINIGRQQTSGLDISFTHDRETAHWGRFRLYADATWTRSFERTESCSPTDPTTRRGAGACVGGQRLIDFTGEFRYPEWLVNTGVSWKKGDWSSRVWANYTDGYYDDDQRDGVPANRRIASSTIFNASISWDVTAEGYVSLTLRNLFDREAPLALGSATNVDQFNHDTLGRAYTLSYTQRF